MKIGKSTAGLQSPVTSEMSRAGEDAITAIQSGSPEPRNTDATESTRRFVFIDALRGIAAVGVVLHHLLHNTVLEATLRQVLPVWFQQLSRDGAYGVQIFFVISGFVIAHSLRSFDFTARSTVAFILRRQIRLDPPYWVALSFALLLLSIETAIPGLQTSGFPSSFGVVALNIVYLHNISGVSQLLGVAWTLCLEIQFYILFICALLLSRVGRSVPPARAVPLSSLLLLVCSGIISMACFERHEDNGPYFPYWSGLFLPFWFYFVAGVLCYWYLHRKVSGLVFWAFVSLFAGATMLHGIPSEMVAGLFSVMLLYMVGRRGHLTNLLGSRWFQYPGRISYSLYLVHLPILSCIMRGGYKLTQENPWAALGWYVAALAASFLGAHLLYIWVEAPCVKLLARMKGRNIGTAKKQVEAPEISVPVIVDRQLARNEGIM